MRTSLKRPLSAAVQLLALFALGGCWWHESDVAALEASDRPRRSPVPDGLYCNLEVDERGYRLETDCARFAWDPAERRLRVTEVDEDGAEGETGWADVARLGHGLTLLQSDQTADAAGPRYELFAIVARREGYVSVPLPPPGARDAIAEEEGVAVQPVSDPGDYGRILAGAPASVRAVVERSAVAWLQAAPPPGVDKFAPSDPGADEDDVPPLYSIRIDALESGLTREAALEKAIARLREALERAAQG